MTHRTLSVSLLAMVLGIAIVQPAWGASPKEVLETFFGGASAILRSADLERGTEAPRKAIRALVNEIFDYQDAAARALGPAWQSKTPAQQAEFVRLFADFLERSYIGFLGTKANVSGGFQVRYLEESITGDSAAVATTLLTRSGSDLDVDYFMVRRGDRWMVRDVVVDGMSLIGNYRAQFNRILSTSSYADLVAKMQGEGPEVPGPAVAVTVAAMPVAAAPVAVAEAAPTAAPAPTATPVAVVEAAPTAAPAPTATPVTVAEAAPTAAEPAAAEPVAVAPEPAKPSSPPAAAVPVVIASPKPPREVQVAARPVEITASKVEAVHASAPERPTPVQAASKGTNGAAASRYWIQVGAFRTMEAAAQLADRLRRLGMVASHDPITSAPGHSVGARARVRVGPFATHSDARSKLRELIARGYAPFIAQARN